MLEDSDRLLATIEQVLRTGRMGAASRKLNLSRIDRSPTWSKNAWRAPAPSTAFRRNRSQYHPGPPAAILGDADEVRAAVSNLIDNAVKYSGKRREGHRGDVPKWTASSYPCA